MQQANSSKLRGGLWQLKYIVHRPEKNIPCGSVGRKHPEALGSELANAQYCLLGQGWKRSVRLHCCGDVLSFLGLQAVDSRIGMTTVPRVTPARKRGVILSSSEFDMNNV